MSDKWTRRQFLGVAAASGAAVVLGACKPEATPTAEAVEEPADEPKEAPVEAEEINFLCRTDIINAYAADVAVEEWNANFPSQVIMDEPAGDVATKVQAAQAAGDLVWDGFSVMEGPWATMEWVERGLIQPLDDYVDASQIPNADKLVPGIVETIRTVASYEDKLYGIPGNVGSVGLAWMTEPLEEAGIDEQPWTWDEVKEAAIKVQEGGTGMVPFATACRALCDLYALMWGATDEPIDEDGVVDIRGEASIAAVTWFREMIEEGLFDWTLAFGDWLKGDVAMIHSFDVAGTMAQQTFGMDAARQGVGIYREPDDLKAGVPFWINMSVLFNQAENASGMVDFFLWWFGPDNEKTGKQITEVAAKPCYTYTYEQFVEGNPDQQWQKEAIDIIAESRWFPVNRAYAIANTHVGPALEKCYDLNQAFEPEQAMQEAYDNIMADLAELREA
jgi:ABC-type glycerol-3-phosphate transport system substrate-binding protein